MLHTSLDYVAFAPGSLRFRVEFEVTRGCPSCSTYGDGTHAFLVENQEYVFAEWDPGTATLELTHTFELPGGNEGTLDVIIVAVEEPPEADHDLAATEPCDDTEGLVLDEDRAASTDPDGDIDLEFWLVNGDPAGHGTVLPFGSSYQISLEARDERGATHRTEPQWVYVSVAGPCSL